MQTATEPTTDAAHLAAAMFAAAADEVARQSDEIDADNHPASLARLDVAAATAVLLVVNEKRARQVLRKKAGRAAADEMLATAATMLEESASDGWLLADS